MALHPALEPIAFLIGRWEGEGRGEYPTIDDFIYSEAIDFRPGPDKPFLSYIQRTSGADGGPLHSEAGFLRMTDRGPELVIAQPTGVAEVHAGTLEASALDFSSVAVTTTPDAKEVKAVRRRIEVVADELSYTLDMAFAHVPLSLHLEATLKRA